MEPRNFLRKQLAVQSGKGNAPSDKESVPSNKGTVSSILQSKPATRRTVQFDEEDKPETARPELKKETPSEKSPGLQKAKSSTSIRVKELPVSEEKAVSEIGWQPLSQSMVNQMTPEAKAELALALAKFFIDLPGVPLDQIKLSNFSYSSNQKLIRLSNNKTTKAFQDSVEGFGNLLCRIFTGKKVPRDTEGALIREKLNPLYSDLTHLRVIRLLTEACLTGIKTGEGEPQRLRFFGAIISILDRFKNDLSDTHTVLAREGYALEHNAEPGSGEEKALNTQYDHFATVALLAQDYSGTWTRPVGSLGLAQQYGELHDANGIIQSAVSRAVEHQNGVYLIHGFGKTTQLLKAEQLFAGRRASPVYMDLAHFPHTDKLGTFIRLIDAHGFQMLKMSEATKPLFESLAEPLSVLQPFMKTMAEKAGLPPYSGTPPTLNELKSAFMRFIQIITAEYPIVILADNLDKAPEVLKDLMGELLSSDAAGFVVCGTYADKDSLPKWELGYEWNKPVSLPELTDKDIAAMLRDTFKKSVEQDETLNTIYGFIQSLKGDETTFHENALKKVIRFIDILTGKPLAWSQRELAKLALSQFESPYFSVKNGQVIFNKSKVLELIKQAGEQWGVEDLYFGSLVSKQDMALLDPLIWLQDQTEFLSAEFLTQLQQSAVPLNHKDKIIDLMERLCRKGAAVKAGGTYYLRPDLVAYIRHYTPASVPSNDLKKVYFDCAAGDPVLKAAILETIDLGSEKNIEGFIKQIEHALTLSEKDAKNTVQIISNLFKSNTFIMLTGGSNGLYTEFASAAIRLQEQGEFSKALRYYQYAKMLNVVAHLDVHPNDPLRATLATTTDSLREIDCYMEAGDYSGALAQADVILEIKGLSKTDTAILHLKKGNIYLELNYLQDALNEWATAVGMEKAHSGLVVVSPEKSEKELFKIILADIVGVSGLFQPAIDNSKRAIENQSLDLFNKVSTPVQHTLTKSFDMRLNRYRSIIFSQTLVKHIEKKSGFENAQIAVNSLTPEQAKALGDAFKTLKITKVHVASGKKEIPVSDAISQKELIILSPAEALKVLREVPDKSMPMTFQLKADKQSDTLKSIEKDIKKQVANYLEIDVQLEAVGKIIKWGFQDPQYTIICFYYAFKTIKTLVKEKGFFNQDLMAAFSAVTYLVLCPLNKWDTASEMYEFAKGLLETTYTDIKTQADAGIILSLASAFKESITARRFLETLNRYLKAAQELRDPVTIGLNAQFAAFYGLYGYELLADLPGIIHFIHSRLKIAKDALPTTALPVQSYLQVAEALYYSSTRENPRRDIVLIEKDKFTKELSSLVSRAIQKAKNDELHKGKSSFGTINTADFLAALVIETVPGYILEALSGTREIGKSATEFLATLGITIKAEHIKRLPKSGSESKKVKKPGDYSVTVSLDLTKASPTIITLLMLKLFNRDPLGDVFISWMEAELYKGNIGHVIELYTYYEKQNLHLEGKSWIYNGIKARYMYMAALYLTLHQTLESEQERKTHSGQIKLWATELTKDLTDKAIEGKETGGVIKTMEHWGKDNSNFDHMRYVCLGFSYLTRIKPLKPSKKEEEPKEAAENKELRRQAAFEFKMAADLARANGFPVEQAYALVFAAEQLYLVDAVTEARELVRQAMAVLVKIKAFGAIETFRKTLPKELFTPDKLPLLLHPAKGLEKFHGLSSLDQILKHALISMTDATGSPDVVLSYNGTTLYPSTDQSLKTYPDLSGKDFILLNEKMEPVESGKVSADGKYHIVMDIFGYRLSASFFASGIELDLICNQVRLLQEKVKEALLLLKKQTPDDVETLKKMVSEQTRRKSSVDTKNLSSLKEKLLEVQQHTKDKSGRPIQLKLLDEIVRESIEKNVPCSAFALQLAQLWRETAEDFIQKSGEQFSNTTKSKLTKTLFSDKTSSKEFQLSVCRFYYELAYLIARREGDADTLGKLKKDIGEGFLNRFFADMQAVRPNPGYMKTLDSVYTALQTGSMSISAHISGLMMQEFSEGTIHIYLIRVSRSIGSGLIVLDPQNPEQTSPVEISRRNAPLTLIKQLIAAIASQSGMGTYAVLRDIHGQNVDQDYFRQKQAQDLNITSIGAIAVGEDYYLIMEKSGMEMLVMPENVEDFREKLTYLIRLYQTLSGIQAMGDVLRVLSEQKLTITSAREANYPFLSHEINTDIDTLNQLISSKQNPLAVIEHFGMMVEKTARHLDSATLSVSDKKQAIDLMFSLFSRLYSYVTQEEIPSSAREIQLALRRFKAAMKNDYVSILLEGAYANIIRHMVIPFFNKLAVARIPQQDVPLLLFDAIEYDQNKKSIDDLLGRLHPVQQPDVRNKRGETLFLAVMTSPMSVKDKQSVLKRIAFVLSNVKSFEFESPLDTPEQRSKLSDLKLKKQSKEGLSKQESQDLADLEEKLESLPKQLSQFGQTMTASANMMTLLFTRTAGGDTPLHLAARQHPGLVKTILAIASDSSPLFVTMLLETVNVNQETPLLTCLSTLNAVETKQSAKEISAWKSALKSLGDAIRTYWALVSLPAHIQVAKGLEAEFSRIQKIVTDVHHHVQVFQKNIFETIDHARGGYYDRYLDLMAIMLTKAAATMFSPKIALTKTLLVQAQQQNFLIYLMQTISFPDVSSLPQDEKMLRESIAGIVTKRLREMTLKEWNTVLSNSPGLFSALKGKLSTATDNIDVLTKLPDEQTLGNISKLLTDLIGTFSQEFLIGLIKSLQQLPLRPKETPKQLEERISVTYNIPQSHLYYKGYVPTLGTLLDLPPSQSLPALLQALSDDNGISCVQFYRDAIVAQSDEATRVSAVEKFESQFKISLKDPVVTRILDMLADLSGIDIRATLNELVPSLRQVLANPAPFLKDMKTLYETELLFSKYETASDELIKLYGKRLKDVFHDEKPGENETENPFYFLKKTMGDLHTDLSNIYTGILVYPKTISQIEKRKNMIFDLMDRFSQLGNLLGIHLLVQGVFSRNEVGRVVKTLSDTSRPASLTEKQKAFYLLVDFLFIMKNQRYRMALNFTRALNFRTLPFGGIYATEFTFARDRNLTANIYDVAKNVASLQLPVTMDLSSLEEAVFSALKSYFHSSKLTDAALYDTAVDILKFYEKRGPNPLTQQLLEIPGALPEPVLDASLEARLFSTLYTFVIAALQIKDPTQQSPELFEFLKECQRRGWNTVMDLQNRFYESFISSLSPQEYKELKNVSISRFWSYLYLVTLYHVMFKEMITKPESVSAEPIINTYTPSVQMGLTTVFNQSIFFDSPTQYWPHFVMLRQFLLATASLMYSQYMKKSLNDVSFSLQELDVAVEDVIGLKELIPYVQILTGATETILSKQLDEELKKPHSNSGRNIATILNIALAENCTSVVMRIMKSPGKSEPSPFSMIREQDISPSVFNTLFLHLMKEGKVDWLNTFLDKFSNKQTLVYNAISHSFTRFAAFAGTSSPDILNAVFGILEDSQIKTILSSRTTDGSTIFEHILNLLIIASSEELAAFSSMNPKLLEQRRKNQGNIKTKTPLALKILGEIIRRLTLREALLFKDSKMPFKVFLDTYLTKVLDKSEGTFIESLSSIFESGASFARLLPTTSLDTLLSSPDDLTTKKFETFIGKANPGETDTSGGSLSKSERMKRYFLFLMDVTILSKNLSVSRGKKTREAIIELYLTKGGDRYLADFKHVDQLLQAVILLKDDKTIAKASIFSHESVRKFMNEISSELEKEFERFKKSDAVAVIAPTVVAPPSPDISPDSFVRTVIEIETPSLTEFNKFWNKQKKEGYIQTSEEKPSSFSKGASSLGASSFGESSTGFYKADSEELTSESQSPSLSRKGSTGSRGSRSSVSTEESFYKLPEQPSLFNVDWALILQNALSGLSGKKPSYWDHQNTLLSNLFSDFEEEQSVLFFSGEEIVDPLPDGSCWLSACNIGAGLTLGTEEEVRQALVTFIEKNPALQIWILDRLRELFAYGGITDDSVIKGYSESYKTKLKSMVAESPNLPNYLGTGELPVAVQDTQAYKDFIDELTTSKTWGGVIELQLLSEFLNQPIIIYTPSSRDPLEVLTPIGNYTGALQGRSPILLYLKNGHYYLILHNDSNHQKLQLIGPTPAPTETKPPFPSSSQDKKPFPAPEEKKGTQTLKELFAKADNLKLPSTKVFAHYLTIAKDHKLFGTLGLETPDEKTINGLKDLAANLDAFGVNPVTFSTFVSNFSQAAIAGKSLSHNDISFWRDLVHKIS